MVKYIARVLAAFTVGLILGCCGQAIADFPYRYYNIQAESWIGTLQGKTPADDLSFEVCKPEPGKQNKCTAMLTPHFQSFKSSFQKMEVDLKECQAQLRDLINK